MPDIKGKYISNKASTKYLDSDLYYMHIMNTWAPLELNIFNNSPANAPKI